MWWQKIKLQTEQQTLNKVVKKFPHEFLFEQDLKFV